jgi:hypothetical protein
MLSLCPDLSDLYHRIRSRSARDQRPIAYRHMDGAREVHAMSAITRERCISDNFQSYDLGWLQERATRIELASSAWEGENAGWHDQGLPAFPLLNTHLGATEDYRPRPCFTDLCGTTVARGTTRCSPGKPGQLMKGGP